MTSRSTNSPSSSPPSSPPSAAVSDAACGSQDEAMRKEEGILEQQSEREREQEKRRAQNILPDVTEDDSHLKELDWFLSRSQVSPSHPTRLNKSNEDPRASPPPF